MIKFLRIFKKMKIIFQLWHELKMRLSRRDLNLRFREREIFWTHCGKNLGFEIDGKSENFSRPVLILKKFSRETFVGIPLTTKPKRGNYFFKISFADGKKSIAIFSQIRTFDQKRLIKKIGEISPTEFAILKRKLRQLFK